VTNNSNEGLPLQGKMTNSVGGLERQNRTAVADGVFDADIIEACTPYALLF
jgi:hypothetical protein